MVKGDRLPYTLHLISYLYRNIADKTSGTVAQNLSTVFVRKRCNDLLVAVHKGHEQCVLAVAGTPYGYLTAIVITVHNVGIGMSTSQISLYRGLYISSFVQVSLINELREVSRSLKSAAQFMVSLDVMLVYAARSVTVIACPQGAVVGNARIHCERDGARMRGETVYGHNGVETVYIHWQYVHAQLFRYEEEAFVEAQHCGFGITLALNEYGYAVTTLHQRAEKGDILSKGDVALVGDGKFRKLDGIELQPAEHEPDNGIEAGTLVGHYDDTGAECHEAHGVEHGLVIADYHAGLGEVLAVGIVRNELHAGEEAHIEAVASGDELMEEEPLALCALGEDEEEETEDIAHGKLGYPHRPTEPRASQCANGKGAFAVAAAALDEPMEYQRRHEPSHKHHATHTDDGDFGKGVKGRMTRHYQRTDAYEHDKG